MATAKPSMPQAFAYDVFLSYSSEDREWVRGELLPKLKAAGLRVCIDFLDFRVGAAIVQEVERAILESRKTLLVLTPAYLESQWAELEGVMLQTLDPGNRELRLVPVLRTACNLPPRLSAFIRVDLTGEEDDGVAWNRLLTALGAPPGQEQPSVPPEEDWLLIHSYGMPPNFTGRTAERRMLSDWLKEGPPLFVLRALGGFGKSALVWHWLLHDVAKDRWPRVLWWCFYEPEAGFDLFLARALEYLGVEPQPFAPRKQVEELLLKLRRSDVLLVLDGFERELRAFAGLGGPYQGDEEAIPQGEKCDCVSVTAETFLRGVASLPGVRGRVLLTTRLRPRVLEARGGELLAGCREEELKELSADDAVAFFLAEGIRGTRSEIEAVCSRYGYHPLSLRLLAGLILKDLRTPGDIAVANRLDVSGDIVQRRNHVLAQAYQSLPLPTRQVLSRLACFRSAVRYEVLIALNRESPQEEIDAALQELKASGLLQHDARNGQFDLHPIVRRYAYDRLGQEERQATHRTLRDYFRAVPAPEQIHSLTDLTPLIELYHHLARGGEYDAALNLFRQRLSKRIYLTFGAYETHIDLLLALFPKGEDHTPGVRLKEDQAWILNTLANSRAFAGQPRRAMPLFARSNDIYEGFGNRMSLAIGLGNLAYAVQVPLGHLKMAEEGLRRQIDLCRGIGEVFREMDGHQHLGYVLTYRGCWAEAERETELARASFESLGKLPPQSVALSYCSFLHLLHARALGDEADSAALASRALATANLTLRLAEESARTGLAVERNYVRAYWLLGAASCEMGDLDISDRYLTEALTRCRRINLVEGEAAILLDLGRLRLAQGKRTEARALAREALAITERCENVLQAADVHLLLARLAIEEVCLEEARRHAGEARRLATCDGPPDYTYRVAFDEAEALLAGLGLE
jgi:tetratricopeptide (TPR) repeat protein